MLKAMAAPPKDLEKQIRPWIAKNVKESSRLGWSREARVGRAAEPRETTKALRARREAITLFPPVTQKMRLSADWD